MDKQEYQEIINGIKQGYARGDYERVLMFAREISPRKIRETKILEMIADAYEAVGKPGLTRQTLEIIYERMQNGKQIAYRLAEQCIRLKDIDSAVKYYEDFCRVAPNDNRKYILKYEIATAGGLTIYDRIKILEEYTQKEIDEEGLYELARLYHEAGMGDQCAATVDEFTIWFSDGDYIKKALQLKFAHTPLSKKQQALYEELMSEYMEDDEIFLNNPNEQPVRNAFDEEAEEFANRYLNGTLENTKPIDTAAVVQAEAEAKEAERREIAATKKLSLNESAAFAAMAANMANEAELSKEYAAKEPEPETEKTPLERMIEEPESEYPETGGNYQRRTAEVNQGSLNLNVGVTDDDYVEGQMSIDQMFQMYANNIENNEANRQAVEQVEAERLRQIRESVESSIQSKPLLDIDEEPEPTPSDQLKETAAQGAIPEAASVSEEPEPVRVASVPKTANEKIPGDLTIEEMLAAMGEGVGDDVLMAEPVKNETPKVQEAEPIVEPKEEPIDEEALEKAAMAASVATITAAEAAKIHRHEEREMKHEQRKLEHEIKKEQKKAEAELKKEQKKLEKEQQPEILFDVEPKPEEYVITNTIEDTPAIEAEIDSIMAELPISDFAEKPQSEAVPAAAGAAVIAGAAAVAAAGAAAETKEPDLDFDLDSAMDDIMSELPMDDFAEEVKPEAAIEAEAEVQAPKEEPAVAKMPEPAAAKEPVQTVAVEEPAGAAVIAGTAAVAAESKEPDLDFDLDSAMDDIMSELPMDDFAEEVKPEAAIEAEVEVQAPKEEPLVAKMPAAVEEPVQAAAIEEPAGAAVIAGVAAAAETKEPDMDFDLDSAMDDIMSELPMDDFAEEVKPEAAIEEEPEVQAPKEEPAVVKMPEPAAVEEPEPKVKLQEEISQRYRITPEIHEDLAEFLLVSGMQENIETAIGNIVCIKKKGNINGGNLIVTGDAKSGKTFLAITVVKAVTQELGDGNGRVAKVQATSINGKNIDKIFEKVAGNDLIIENVGDLEEDTLRSILYAMENGTAKNMVVFEGNNLAIETMINNHPEMEELFKNRVDIKELNISQWADVACDYANQKGYNVSDMALLALHAEIDKINMPTRRFGYEDAVNIIDRAIANANKRSTGRLFSAYKRGGSRNIDIIEADFNK